MPESEPPARAATVRRAGSGAAIDGLLGWEKRGGAEKVRCMVFRVREFLCRAGETGAGDGRRARRRPGRREPQTGGGRTALFFSRPPRPRLAPFIALGRARIKASRSVLPCAPPIGGAEAGGARRRGPRTRVWSAFGPKREGPIARPQRCSRSAPMSAPQRSARAPRRARTAAPCPHKMPGRRTSRLAGPK